MIAYADVRQAVARHMAAVGAAEASEVYHALGRELGTMDASHPGRHASPWDRFRGQVRRALNELANRGELVKESYPRQAGIGSWQPPQYLTRELAVQREQRAREREAEETRQREWAEETTERFSQLGINADVRWHNQRVTVSGQAALKVLAAMEGRFPVSASKLAEAVMQAWLDAKVAPVGLDSRRAEVAVEAVLGALGGGQP